MKSQKHKAKKLKKQVLAKFNIEKEKVFNPDSQKNFDELGNEIKPGMCQKFSNLFKWYTLLRGVTDDQLRIICGTDGALYLIFIRYASKFFAVITLVNTLIFLPFYLSGINSINCNDPNLKE